jgi:hypothetical protein
VKAVSDGFAKALIGQRRMRGASTSEAAFRPLVLASVYRAAIEALQPAPQAHRSARTTAKTADEALTEAAFRSLPERWRAAVWLSEVEGFDAERLAPVIGVSAAVATQLIARGRRGLVGRFVQAHRPAPDHLGTVLRAQALAVPADLADAVADHWISARRARKTILAPATGWLEERAVRPMWVAVGTMFGIGLIGLGVVPGGAAVHSSLGNTGTSTSTGAVPVPISKTASPASPLNLFPVLNQGGAGSFITTASPVATGAGVSTIGGVTTTTGTGSTTSGGSTGTTTPGGGSTGTTPGSGTTSSTPSTPSGASTKTVLSVPGVASLTESGSSTNPTVQLNILPGTKTPVSVTVNCNPLPPGVGLSVGSTSVGCNSTGSSTTKNTTTSGGSTNAVSGTVSTVTGTVNNVVTGVTKVLKGL